MVGSFMNFTANADCKLLSCKDRDVYNVRLESDPDGNQCWFCGPGRNSCNNNDVVPKVNGYGEIVELHQCSITFIGFGNKFVPYNPGTFCDDSELSSRSGSSGIDTTNAIKLYKIKGYSTKESSLGDLKFFNGSASCIYIKCEDGYMPNETKNKCIIDNRKENCEKTGGQWESTNKKCSCDFEKGLTHETNALTCKCSNTDYIFDTSSNKCIENPKEVENRKKNDCENSDLPGKWNRTKCECDANKNLIESNGKCKCKSTDYVRSGQQCVLSDAAQRREKCKKIKAAKWKNGECVCSNPEHTIIDGECVPDPDIAKCNQHKAGDRYWDYNLKKCTCNDPDKIIQGDKCVQNPKIAKCNKINGAQWIDGKCECVEEGMDWNDNETQCVETEEARNQAAQAAAQKKIESAVTELDRLSDSFKVSKWRNAEGKFNSARLASDSIAAVVLGTTGGIITSKIIKKNQVEDGFEDLECHIGGQKVADWGDEFRAGIQ